MTIGTYTFYTTTHSFAIEIFGFFKEFFEFIVNSGHNLLNFTKYFMFLGCQIKLTNECIKIRNLININKFRLFNLAVLPLFFR